MDSQQRRQDSGSAVSNHRITTAAIVPQNNPNVSMTIAALPSHHLVQGMNEPNTVQMSMMPQFFSMVPQQVQFTASTSSPSNNPNEAIEQLNWAAMPMNAFVPNSAAQQQMLQVVDASNPSSTGVNNSNNGTNHSATGLVGQNTANAGTNLSNTGMNNRSSTLHHHPQFRLNNDGSRTQKLSQPVLPPVVRTSHRAPSAVSQPMRQCTSPVPRCVMDTIDRVHQDHLDNANTARYPSSIDIDSIIESCASSSNTNLPTMIPARILPIKQENNKKYNTNSNTEVTKQRSNLPVFDALGNPRTKKPDNKTFRAQWKLVDVFNSEEDMQRRRLMEKVSKRKTNDLKTGRKITYRCNSWRRLGCRYSMYAIFQDDEKIALYERGDHIHAMGRVVSRKRFLGTDVGVTQVTVQPALEAADIKAEHIQSIQEQVIQRQQQQSINNNNNNITNQQRNNNHQNQPQSISLGNASIQCLPLNLQLNQNNNTQQQLASSNQLMSNQHQALNAHQPITSQQHSFNLINTGGQTNNSLQTLTAVTLNMAPNSIQLPTGQQMMIALPQGMIPASHAAGSFRLENGQLKFETAPMNGGNDK